MLCISFGAALGALSRWGLALAINSLSANIPPGTLLANLLGSFLMGVALALLATVPSMGQWVRPVFVTGFLGSFTTFSTFAAEMGQLALKQRFDWLGLGICLHVFGSIALFLAGFLLAEGLTSGKEIF